MTHSVIGSRKRGRSVGDEESKDFTPLSKRINNLHINNGTYSNNSNLTLEEAAPETSTDSEPSRSSSYIETGTNGGIASNMPHQEISHLPMYSPNLPITENPFYYEPNKMLYYLYLERMQRSGQPY